MLYILGLMTYVHIQCHSQGGLCRQNEGVVGEGYTLKEACLMVRSSVIQQRVFALHLLGAVITTVRQGMEHGGAIEVLDLSNLDLEAAGTAQHCMASHIYTVIAGHLVQSTGHFLMY